jgi:glutathione S-transferase
MITLFQPPPVWGIPNISPPCMKLETWLRLTGIPYTSAVADLRTAPKQKVPYIEDDGVRMGDSTLILEHLKKKYGKDPDAALSPTERAIGLAFRRMLKENTVWVLAYHRFVVDENWATFRRLLGELMAPGAPQGVKDQATSSFREVLRGALYAQGMGRHTLDEVDQIGIGDMEAVADFLADNEFFMGDLPTGVDATVYAYVSNIIEVPINSATKDYALGRGTLLAYCDRMRSKFFPDLASAPRG